MDAEPRSPKGRRTRARLLQAGKSVFERDGFLQARITDIAAEAQISHGTFYHYFDSKESLFREIAEEVEVRLVSMNDIAADSGKNGAAADSGKNGAAADGGKNGAAADGGKNGAAADGGSKGAAAERGDAVDRIRAANRSYLQAYKQEARIMRVIEEVSRYDDEVRAVRVKRDDYLGVRLEAAIAHLQADGLADARIDTRYAAMALGGMVARFAEVMFIGGGSYDLDTAVEQLTLLWANALGMAAQKLPTKVRTRSGAA
jgi:AcrR family transcriptional regulator